MSARLERVARVPRETTAHAEAVRPRPWRRAPLLALAVVALVAGVCGGLLRAGVALPGPPDVLGTAATAHAVLMLTGFLGTLIAIERAVAMRIAAAWWAPLASGAGTLALLAGWTMAANTLFVGAAVVHAVVHAWRLRHRPDASSTILALAALAWVVGNTANALGAVTGAVAPWWFAFAVLTVAAERLELAHPARARRGAASALQAVVAALFAAAVLCEIASAAGTLAFGMSLLAFAVWLARFDAARRTLRIARLGRYMAIALLAGQAWLAVAGAAWIALAFGAPTHDAALHALGIGFVLGMVFAHGPMILPSVLRVRVAYRAWFYVPLALLHASLALRLGGAAIDPAWRAVGSVGNALALVLYAAAMVDGALGARRASLARRPGPSSLAPP